MATLLPPGKIQFSDANGNPLAAGSVGFYIPGTLTLKNTWQDAAQTILNTNPVTLDSSGEAIIYGSGIYRQIVKDSLGNTIWDQLTGDYSEVATMYQGTTAPTISTVGLSTLEGVWWHDTSANEIKVMSQDGTTWIVAGTVNEAPTYKFSASVNGSVNITGGTITGLASPLPVASGGTGQTTFPALDNARLAKTSAYAVANADKGSTVALGGNSFYTLTFNAASGYDANFSVLVLNEDTGRGKTIAISGGTSFILWPGQSSIVFNQNNVWQTYNTPARWQKSGATFYVDPLNGNDNNDGLATGTGAFLTIQGAYNVVRSHLDCIGGFPTIQLADGTYSVGSGVNINYSLVGSAQLLIQGNNTTPGNVIVSCSAGGSCFTVRDGGATVTLSGMTLSTAGNGSTLLNVSQNAVCDICSAGPVNFNAAPLGVHISANTWASVNVLGNYTVNGSASDHILCENNAYINYGSFIVTGASGLAFTTFAGAVNGGVISAGGSAMTFSGFSGVTGVKYSATMNGVIASNSTVYPGGTAGTTSTGGQYS